MNESIILAGHRRDTKGRLVEETMIAPIDMARDDLVIDLVGKARAASDVLRDFKATVFGEIQAFVDLSFEQYGIVPRGSKGKGNITLMSFDGRYKVQVAVAEHIAFDERLQAAKHLIDECITDWASDSRPEIKVLVQDAFQTDKAGEINVGRVLGLRRLDIKDPRWMEAMKAIGDSIKVVGSKSYVRFYERVGNTDQYQAISLDVAAL